MTHGERDPSAGDSSEPYLPEPASVPFEHPLLLVKAPAAYDGASFAAGQDCGTRVAACIARVTALELVERSRWWNRRERRRMAGALVAYAEALEADADADGRCASSAGPQAGAIPQESRASAAARPRRY